MDWEAQWATHGHHFRDGFVHIDFAEFGRSAPVLKLQPGAGFGDLSHPTTRLMLKMLTQSMRGQVVIDIGCGSGVLALSAAVLGAKMVYGIDIDLAALDHSRQNASLNNLSDCCSFSLPSEFQSTSTPEPLLICMNMIQTEQIAAWHSLPSLHAHEGHCLTSGIRIEERDAYLKMVNNWGWHLVAEHEESQWLAFQFTFLNTETRLNKEG